MKKCDASIQLSEIGLEQDKKVHVEFEYIECCKVFDGIHLQAKFVT